jgi:hypothetical protein
MKCYYSMIPLFLVEWKKGKGDRQKAPIKIGRR